MRKKALAIIFAALTLFFCLPPGAFGAAGASSTALAATKKQLNAILPSNMPVLEELLGKAAAAEGCELVVKRAAPGAQYSEMLAEQQTDENSAVYDICWIESDSAARELYDNGITMMDLNAEAAGSQMQSLARLVPAYARFLNAQAVYGLPVGTYASGTLVNLPLLAALLGAKDQKALARDLSGCSFDEWEALVLAIKKYLAKPEALSVKLSGHAYTFPPYRPEAAKPMRGVYAGASGASPNAFANEIDAVISSVFESPAQLDATSAADRGTALAGPLAVLGSAVEFETAYLSDADGNALRGEGFASVPAISEQDAAELFAAGCMVFLRGGTQLGMEIAETHPQMVNSIYIVPAKLPVWEDGAENFNTELAIHVEGVLGIDLESKAKTDAVAVLLRLFSQEDSRREIETRMHLLPFTNLYPAGTLPRAISAAVSSGSYYMPVQERRKTLLQSEQLGSWVNKNLMEKAVWDADDAAAFLTAAQNIVAAA